MRTSKLFLLFFFLNSNSAFSQDAPETTNPKTIDPVTTQSAEKISPKWAYQLAPLLNSDIADQVHTIKVSEMDIPVLNFWNKGRIERGRAIFLPAQNESPASYRLAHPLAMQLSNLGWQVYTPAFPHFDFVMNLEKNIENQDNTQQEKPSSDNVDNNSQENIKDDNSANQNNYFKSIEQYQNWFNETLVSTMQLFSNSTLPTIIIANQKSVYWLLGASQQLNKASHFVLLDPQLPYFSVNELESKFSQQKHAVFLFSNKDNIKDPFVRAFRQKKWLTNNIRINQGFIYRNQLAIENDYVAKLITGWVHKKQN